MRTPPPEFVERLRTAFPGEGWTVAWDEAFGRWKIGGLSAAGRPVWQFWGWRYDAQGNPIEPDPATGLYPFRDLDQQAQDEIIRAMQRTYIGQTGYGEEDWARRIAERTAFNRTLQRTRRKAKAALFADMITEMRIGRPWLKHHAGSDRSRQVAMGSLGLSSETL